MQTSDKRIRPFKADWEKSNKQHTLPAKAIYKMIAAAYPESSIKTYKIIDGGCANINVQIEFEQEDCPISLRIYLRDQAAAYREQKIADLVHQNIPAPRIHYIGSVDNYRFAIAEFMPGVTLRDVLLDDQSCDLSDIMHQVGILLSKMKTYEFSHAGFFDQNLNITTPINRNECIVFADSCLQNRTVISQLSATTCSTIGRYLGKYRHLLPESEEKHLVHADFDPANILVFPANGHWQISAVLDWEFAFSGSTLWDIANMLRYAHHMPATFQRSFLAGLEDGGISLSKNWQITIHLLNLLALLDCLKRANPKTALALCADSRALILYILSDLEKIDD